MAMSLKIQPLPPSPVPPFAVAQADLVEGGFGLEFGGEVFRLVFFGGAAAKVRVQPDGHQVVAAGDILHLENDGLFDALAHAVHKARTARAGAVRDARISS